MPLVVSGVIQDVTERVRAEEALRESEQRYRSLFEDSPVAMWEDDYSAVKAHLEELAAGGIDDVIAHLLADPEEYARCVELSRTLDANKAAVRLFEAESREELLARNADLYRSGTDRGIYRFWAAMLAGERSATFEEANLTLRGKEIQVLETCTVVPGHEQTFDRVYIADIDITERTRQAATLRESEQLLKQSQQAARVGHYVYDIPSGMWTSSATLDEIFGIGDAYARSVDGWLAIVHPDQRTEMSDYLREHVLRDRLPFDREYRIVRVADGVERWVHGLGTLEMDDDGRRGTDVRRHPGRDRAQARRRCRARLRGAPAPHRRGRRARPWATWWRHATRTRPATSAVSPSWRRRSPRSWGCPPKSSRGCASPRSSTTSARSPCPPRSSPSPAG